MSNIIASSGVTNTGNSICSNNSICVLSGCMANSVMISGGNVLSVTSALPCWPRQEQLQRERRGGSVVHAGNTEFNGIKSTFIGYCLDAEDLGQASAASRTTRGWCGRTRSAT